MPRTEVVASSEALLYINGYKALDLSVSSTGFRTNALRHRTLSTSADRRIAEEFLLNTALRRGDSEVASSVAAYFTDEQLSVLSLRDTQPALGADDRVLPPPVPLDLSLGEAIRQRRSRRTFTGDEMSAEYLAALLASAGGITGTSDASHARSSTAEITFRAAPSAGGLYPVDLYVMPLTVRGVRSRVYRYLRKPAALQAVGDGNTLTEVLGAFATSEDMISLRRANVALLLVAHPWRVMRKYGARGMRFVLMEAGAISQNANLAAVALGYSSVECASVYDDEMNEALGLDGTFRCYLHSIIVGYPG